MPLTLKTIDRSALIEEELHDLKQRFELLEGDRKAYYETSQWAIRQNKEQLNNLRSQNKELKELMTRLKKQEADITVSSHFLSEVEKLDLRLLEYRKKHDEMQGKLDDTLDRVHNLHDELLYIRRESESSKLQMTESPYAKEIRLLENRLDKALIKYNEAQSVKRTYEEIVKKLQEDRLLFDNQINHFERTLKAKRQEVSELELLSRDANHAKELAKNELGRLEQQISEERRQREKELQQKRDLVRIKREENAQLEKPQRPTMEENEINNNARPNESQKEQETDTEREKRRSEYEEVMQMVKEVMGVNHLSEVIQKFQQQKDTHAHLLQLQSQYESKLQELKQKKSQIQTTFEELKYNSESKQSHSARMLEEFTEHLVKAEEGRRDSRMKHEKVAKILIDLTTGVKHLLERLESIPSLAGKGENGPIEENDVLAMLERCQQKLELLYSNIKDKDTAVDQSDDRFLQFTQTMLPSHNTRVKLRPIEFEKNIESDEEDADDDGAEVPDRETLKKFTVQMLNSKMKAKQPKKKGKKKASQDSDD